MYNQSKEIREAIQAGDQALHSLYEAQTKLKKATVEDNQPRVRPFGTAHIFEGKLYIQTGKVKPTSKQLAANPKAEICAFKDGNTQVLYLKNAVATISSFSAPEEVIEF